MAVLPAATSSAMCARAAVVLVGLVARRAVPAARDRRLHHDLAVGQGQRRRVGVDRPRLDPHASAPWGRRPAPGPAGSACRCSSAAWRGSCAPARRSASTRSTQARNASTWWMLSQAPLASTRSKPVQSTAGSFQTAVTASTPAASRAARRRGQSSCRSGNWAQARRRPGGAVATAPPAAAVVKCRWGSGRPPGGRGRSPASRGPLRRSGPRPGGSGCGSGSPTAG